jgi:hypothetical protein
MEDTGKKFKEMSEEELKQKLMDYEVGEVILYNELFQALNQSELEFEREDIYSDSTGFLERWIVDGEPMIIDNLRGGPYVRRGLP